MISSQFLLPAEHRPQNRVQVTPQQKMTIINTLQKKDHICGFMGDGTNDALALRKADVGICVDSGEPS